MKVQVLAPVYVKQLPDQLVEGRFYICEEFALTAHKCCCGCGEDVYNKLSPAKWQLTKNPDGTVSLYPSVGNWKYACQSHYVIRNNRVVEAGPMGAKAIEAVKQQDLRARDAYIAQMNAHADELARQPVGWWATLRALGLQLLHRVRSIWHR